MVTDRPRGILSPSDRAYIQSPDEWTSNHSRAAKAKREAEIRTRAANALLDYSLLFEHFDEQDYDGFIDESDADTGAFIINAYADAVAFLYRLNGTRPGIFADLVERGIQTAEHQKGHLTRVDVSITVETGVGFDEIEQRLEESVTAVTTDELCELHQAGQLSKRELADLLIEHESATEGTAGQAADSD